MTVSEQIIEVLNYICEKVGLVIDWSVVFANENVIPYIELLCRKFITYEIATSVIWIVIGVILLIIVALACRGIKKCIEQKEEEITILLALVVIICSVAGVLIILNQAFDIVTCITFPEKILIEELKSIYGSIN